MAIIRVKSGEKVLSEKERIQLQQELEQLKDEDIDYSDMPALTKEDWDKAITSPMFRKKLKTS